MFSNIKKQSEDHFSPRRLVYALQGAPETPAAAEKPKGPKEKLVALQDIVSANFEEHLRSNQDKIKGFVAECKKKPYKLGQWRQWNKEFLKAMGYEEVSEADAKGVIRQLEYYLKERGSRVIVEGKLGPKGLSALEHHINALEDNDGWVEGVTRMSFFDKYDQPVYLTHEGKWIDYNHEEVDLQTVLPAIATSTEPDELGYFTLKSETTHGKPTIYVDRNGAVYEQKPTTPGPKEWNIYEESDEWDKRREEEVEEAKKRAEEEKKKTPEKPEGPVRPDRRPRRPGDDFKIKDLIVKRPDGTYFQYYITEEGKILGEDLEEISPSEVAKATYIRKKNGKEEYFYEIDEGDGVIAYYDEAGNRTTGRPSDTLRVEEDEAPTAVASLDEDVDYATEELMGDKSAVRVRPGPARRTLLEEDMSIENMEPQRVIDYLKNAGFKVVKHQHDGFYHVEWGDLEGTFEILGDRTIHLHIKGYPDHLVVPEPAKLFKRGYFKASDLSEIGKILQRDASAYIQNQENKSERRA